MQLSEVYFRSWLGLAEWSVPTGGMFLWLKLNIKDTKKMIEVKAKAKNVLFVPGNVFMIDDTQPCSYIRSSYSIATPEQMDLVSISFLETVKKKVNKLVRF